VARAKAAVVVKKDIQIIGSIPYEGDHGDIVCHSLRVNGAGEVAQRTVKSELVNPGPDMALQNTPEPINRPRGQAGHLHGVGIGVACDVLVAAQICLSCCWSRYVDLLLSSV
jgi:hypothetical protein